MHKNSLKHMSALVERYLDPQRKLTIGDIGSYDYNGSYREIFRRSAWTYVGVDVDKGPNVDVVLESPYKFPFPDAHFDVVVSGQAFEHIKFFWLTFLEMARTLRPGGMIFLIAPSRGPEHRYPVDCWRFLPDGYRALAEYAALDCIEANADWAAYPFARGRYWGDAVGVFAKKPYTLAEPAQRYLDSRPAQIKRTFAEKAASTLTLMAEGTLRTIKHAIVRR